MENLNIPYGKQDITADDIAAVIRVLQSSYLTQGPEIERFETNYAQYLGAKYAIAVANGTAALHLAVLALGIKPGQKVLVPSLTFSATANAVRFCGGEVEFVDIDAKTYLIDINQIEERLMRSKKGTYAGIIAVDFAGRAVDMESLFGLAKQYGCWLLEDACHAPGAYFNSSKGERVMSGNGQFADLAIFSFHPVKHIACGEGGMVTTNNPFYFSAIAHLRSHGIVRNPEFYQNSKQVALGDADYRRQNNPEYPGWYMEMQHLGFNYRLTDIQAALGASQLLRADESLQKRREIAAKYAKAFANKSFIIGQSGFFQGHAYHLYVLEVEDRLGLYNHLKNRGVFAQIHYLPVHLMPYYRNRGSKPGELPLTEKYYQHCLSIPMFPKLKSFEIDFVIDSINDYYKNE